jgi:hypothetical protein
MEDERTLRATARQPLAAADGHVGPIEIAVPRARLTTSGRRSCLASFTSFLRAQFSSLASVGKVMFFGCMHRDIDNDAGEIAGRHRSAPGRDRQALLQPPGPQFRQIQLPKIARFLLTLGRRFGMFHRQRASMPPRSTSR